MSYLKNQMKLLSFFNVEINKRKNIQEKRAEKKHETNDGFS